MLCVCRIGSMETTKKWKRHVEKNDAAAALTSATVHPYYLIAVLPCSYANPINHHQAMELTPDFFTIFASKKYGKTQCYGLHNNSRQHENKKSTQIGPAFQILFNEPPQVAVMIWEDLFLLLRVPNYFAIFPLLISTADAKSSNKRSKVSEVKNTPGTEPWLIFATLIRHYI